MMNVSKERVLKVLNFKKPDKLPIFEWYWPEFISKWKKVKGEGIDIYEYYDIDVKSVGIDISPSPKNFKVLEKTEHHTVFKNGWGMVCKKVKNKAMLQFLDFPIKNEEDFYKYEFLDPFSRKRFFESFIDDLSLNKVEPFNIQVERSKDKNFLIGAVLDPYESLWRLRGVENILIDMISNPKFFKEMISKITDFMIELGKQQIKLGKIPGIIILGDIAYKNKTFFSPNMYRKRIFPYLKKMVNEFKKYSIKVFYHTDGDCTTFIDMFLETGIDVLNPIECAAGMDVLKLKERYGNKLAYMGGIDKRKFFGKKEDIYNEVYKKLVNFTDGGLISCLDHSVAPDIPIENYEYYLDLVKKIY